MHHHADTPSTAPDTAGAPASSAGRCPFRRLFTPPVSIAAMLREETRPQHQRAEHHPVQQGAVRGTSSREAYAAYAAQLEHIHTALESALDGASAREPRLAAVFAPHHRRLEAFVADLAHLDPGQRHRAVLGATRDTGAWVAALASTSPVSLLGVLYVLEGSTNGGQFIAPVLRRAWGMPEGEGLRSLDPHGPGARALWAQFRTAIDAITLEPAECAAIVAVAGETFDRLALVMDDVAASTPCIEPAGVA